ncbi:MAG: Do family serine endopeptidase [Deltaproteobacteria bacterium]|nr:Do family serine endopeptidase [Deltaproteobacteria bacterium]
MPEIKSQNYILIISVVLLLVFLNPFFLITPAVLNAESLRESAVVKAIRKVSPAVVNISSEFEVRKRSNPFYGFGMDPGFESFFRDFFDPGFEQKYKRTSLGSGVIIDGKRGFILTNKHVIIKSSTITVALRDGREFKAQIIGADPDSDLAVLRISPKGDLPVIEMGNSNNLMIGETVIAIGNPFGFSNTVTTGVISATNRSIRVDNVLYRDFIQTDASINPGNSGGPLLNIYGELIGINTAIYAKARGIGFAIPINKARRIVTDLIKYGEVIPAWIGVTVQDLDAELAQYLKASTVKGVLVKKTEKSTPAFKAGIHEGDIIRSIGSRKILSQNDFNTAMSNISAGEAIDINIWRDGKTRKVTVKTSSFPTELALDLAHNILGITVENLSKKNRYIYKTHAQEGVVITEISRNSYLSRIGAGPGDVIRQMDELTIKNIKDFKKAIVKYRKKKSLIIRLQRQDQLYNITVKL